MSETPTAAENYDSYQRALKEHPLVIVLFKSQHCQLCMGLGPSFKQIAEKYADSVKSLIFDTEDISKVEGVEGTPALIVYQNGEAVETLVGIGLPGDQQKAVLEEVFDEYANTPVPSQDNSDQPLQADQGLGFIH